MLPLVPLLTALSTATPTDSVSVSPALDHVAETSFVAGLGAAGGDSVGGVGFMMLATHRVKWVELGVDCYGAALLSGMFGLGAVAGLHLGEAFSLRVLGSVGMHSYSAVGRGLLSDDPGISGSTPYAGGRLVLGYSFAGRKGSPHRAFIGVVGVLDEDLNRETRAVTYQSENWIFGGTSEVTSRHTIGQTTLAGFIVGGVDLDLTNY
jgi:hypothetical protein